MSHSLTTTPLFPKTLLAVACALTCAVASTSVFAQTSTNSAALAPVTVTAKRVAQPLSEVLADVSIIDQETLAQQKGKTLGEVLQREHGVAMVTNGGPQTNTSIFLRGGTDKQTLVLIDGMRTSSGTLGTTSLEALPIENVERVEILRGPASGIYGADAIGGVVNIITRKGEGESFQPYANLGYGSWNTMRADVGVIGSTGMWQYAASAGRAKSDGYNVNTNTKSSTYNPDKDGYVLDYGSANVGLNWAKDQSLQASFFASSLDGQSDSSTAASKFDDHNLKRVQALALVSNNRLTDFWNSRLRIGQTKDNYDFVGKSPSKTETIQSQYGWQNDFTFGKQHQATLAFDRLVEDVTSSSYTKQPDKRTTDSVTGVYQGNFGVHQLLLNGRLDHSTQYGNKTTGGIAYGLEVVKNLRFTVGGNTGFRAPTYNELYFPGFGQTTLQPEKSRNFEVGVRYLDKTSQAGLTAYRNKVTNLIVTQTPCATPGYPFGCAANVNNATLEGISVYAGHSFSVQPWGSSSLRADADWQYPHDDTTGSLLQRRARASAKLSAEHRYAGVRFGVEADFVGKRYDSIDQTKPMGGYSLVNLVLGYDLSKNWTLQGRWNNVGNKQYELAKDYATPGSNVFFTLSYRH